MDSATWTGIGAIVASIVGGYFLNGRLAALVDRLEKRQEKAEQETKDLRALVLPLHSVVTNSKIADIPERLADFKSQLQQAVQSAAQASAAVTSMSGRMDRLVTREEFNQRYSAVWKELRSLRRWRHVTGNDMQAMMNKLGLEGRARQHAVELADRDARDDRMDDLPPPEDSRSKSNPDWGNDSNQDMNRT